MLTQRALDWIEGESNGENQRKIVEFLNTLYAEAGGAQIPFDDYILKLGEHLGMKTAETIQFITSLREKGLHSLECNGDELINICIPTRKKIDQRRSIRETAVSWNS